jgi:hypothetical protein
VLIEDIGRVMKIDLENAVARFGSDFVLKQIKGSPQGSPMSVFNANLVAVYLEERNKQYLYNELRIIILRESHVHFVMLRQRWMDDMCVHLATKHLLSADDQARIKTTFSESYSPFGCKDEDPEVFVGFQHKFGAISGERRGVQFSLKTRNLHEIVNSKIPKCLNGNSNIQDSQVMGLMVGAIMRCLDFAESVELCEKSLISMFWEFFICGHSHKIFSKALFSVSSRYRILEKFSKKFSSACVDVVCIDF